MLYIPADVAHLPYNPSETEPVAAVIARTDPHEQESVVLMKGIEEFVVPGRHGEPAAAAVPASLRTVDASGPVD